MQSLEQEMLKTEQLLNGLPPAQVRNLERALRTLSPAQRAYVTTLLHNLERDSTLSRRYLQLLEHFFEKWSGHSLATKLVLISRITELSSQRVPAEAPGGVVPDQLFALPPLVRQAS